MVKVIAWRVKIRIYRNNLLRQNLQNATILEVQIHIDDLKDKLEEVKFTLKISGLYLKKIILWILIINLIRYRLYITKTIY